MPKYVLKRKRKGRVEWYARVPYKDAKGNWRQIWRPASDEAEAKQIAKDILGDLREIGTGPFEERMTLEQYLDKWLTTIKQKIRYRTYEHYEGMLRLYVPSDLRRKDLVKITGDDIQTLIDTLQERGLSAKTVRETYMVLNKSFKHAIRPRKLLKANPCDGIELPQKARQEMKYLSDEDAQRFLEFASKDKWGVIFSLALKTGMRPEEYLALKWSDIDFTRRTVTIQRVLVRKRRVRKLELESWSFEEPKTARSRRTLPLSGALVQALIEHKKQQPEEHRFKHNLVFASDVGTPLSVRNIQGRNFKPILKRAGLPDIRLYDLRHTHATILLLDGVNPKVVSERLGHASAAFTLDTYAHVLPSMQEEATERFEARVSKKSR